MSRLTIPEIRDRLNELAVKHGIPELAVLASATIRETGDRPRASPKSRRVTATLAAEIRAYAASHPLASQVEIGAAFNVNQGRISEALSRKR